MMLGYDCHGKKSPAARGILLAQQESERAASASLLVRVIQSSGSGRRQGTSPHRGPLSLGWHFQPLVTLHFLGMETDIV
ncbi:hypothetical protein EYF80_016057 [Liparis tanakae]|uniref:Uncharacterized protein n=1 Tax=Liparis tanakae TaxID=230148 RepID=A0A4Z2I6L3_9TELE|nr:hypothetical protein EYF80_016057 [Liparis tanakae]